MCLRKVTVGLLILFPLFMILDSCGGSRSTPPGYASGRTVYLKYNIHAQQGPRDCKASYANWTNPGTGHFIIPVNTPVEIGTFKRGFSFIIKDDGRKVFFEFHPRNMAMSVDQYIDLITSPTKVSLKGISEKDHKGIREGKAYIGMTKKGVMRALGYPATHKTPSLEANTWVYWKNRFSTMVVEFDQNGKVKRVQ